MRSLQFSEFGDPEEVLTLREAPIPQPGAGQVLIRVTARPIHPADLLFLQGLYGLRPSLPSVVGFEGGGIIEAAGEGVGLTPGTRVAFAGVGTWQEYLVLAAPLVMPVPEELPEDQACQVIVNPVTAFALLIEAQLKPGDWLLQTAGASTVGKMIITLAKLRGIKTISTVRREEQIADLQALGGDGVINTCKADLVARVSEITEGRGVAAALDAVGGRLGETLLHCLAPRGTLLAYGLLGGKPTPISNGLLLFNSLTIKGFWLIEWLKYAPPQLLETIRQEIIELMSRGQIKAEVAAKYDLREFRRAVSHAQNPEREGKILLTG
jgi:NADPH:quinone reductase-like Zn-dependent oxidoreductase